MRDRKANFMARLKVRHFPQFVKYMGSKSAILPFVVKGLNKVYRTGAICDLFAGSASLSGALGDQVPIISNDVQHYSAILAGAYLRDWRDDGRFQGGADLINQAAALVAEHQNELPRNLDSANCTELAKFQKAERRNQALLNERFDFNWHLFTKNYSGTWWSASQCLWIDALREVAERYRDEPFYNSILSSLMFAMAYCSQGTGHYAQYRDAKSVSSMRDIQTYRGRSIRDYFLKKYNSLDSFAPSAPPQFRHEISALDYVERLNSLPRCTIYADPPYCFVHYSRFYHALETLVLYDFPNLQEMGGTIVKGRYRVDRHQSPFCIHSKVANAFDDLFSGTARSRSDLVLSYSDTGMIPFAELLLHAKRSLGTRYRFSVWRIDHKHMTMGRSKDRDRDVTESLIVAKRKS